MTTSPEEKILLIGVGNPLRGDDVAGALAAKLVRECNYPSFHVIEHDGDGASLIEAWTGAKTVIVVDAVSSDFPPGTIFRFDATRESLRGHLFRNSTHAFGLHEAVELSRALNRLPRQLIVYGIQAKSFEIGALLSDEVEKAVSEVVERILEEPGLVDLPHSST
jgi:hydrogenase maturation protease